MVISKFELDLEKAHTVYFGDDEVKGKLYICVRPARSIRAVSIEIKGEAKLEWEESNGRAKILHRNKECYLYNKIILYQADREKPLQQCEHIFYFTFRLPHALPSSFEGVFGHVRYIIQAKIERRWHVKASTSATIQVQVPLDLNKFPLMSLPVEATREHQYWCLWCISRPVIVSLHLTQACLVPGQELKPSVRIANHSYANIQAINLHLVRMTTYYDSISRGTTKITEALLARKTFHGEVRSGVTRTWHRESFPIPSFPFINLMGCSIIKQKFYLKLKISAQWPHLGFTMCLPVVVGNVPPRHIYNNKS